MFVTSRKRLSGWNAHPPETFTIDSITHIETAANLLAAYPKLRILTAISSDRQAHKYEDISNLDRCAQFATTHTSYLNLLRLLLRLGPNASRVSLDSK